MSYVAEPYAQFVEDLLTSLTGGVAREAFVYAIDEAPFRLSPPGPIVPLSLRVYGQLGGAFVRFVRDTDFTLVVTTDAQRLANDYTIQWKTQSDGSPAAGATLPEEGTPFYVNYDHTGPSGAAPLLSDRNPGSVVRLFAESYGREYAVVSRQLEAIYKAAFLDTSSNSSCSSASYGAAAPTPSARRCSPARRRRRPTSSSPRAPRCRRASRRR